MVRDIEVILPEDECVKFGISLLCLLFLVPNVTKDGTALSQTKISV